MSHEIETMAFANEVPWHGLGQRIDPSSTPEEMLVMAGLDWTVEPRPVFTLGADGETIRIPDKRALVRSKDNKVMGVASEKWTPYQNKDMLEFFREYCESGGAKMETAGSLRGGKLVWALAALQEGFTVNNTDHTKGYILLTASHQVGVSHTARTTMVRVVCANTLAKAEQSKASYTQSHLGNFKTDEARMAIGLAREEVVLAGEAAQKLVTLKLSAFDKMRFLSKVFQPVPEGVNDNEYIYSLINDPSVRNAQLSEVLWSVQRGPGATPGNAWGVFNGITHWADHVAGREAEARLNNAWFGDRAKLKLDAYNSLLEMAA